MPAEFISTSRRIGRSRAVLQLGLVNWPLPYGHCCDTERPKNAATERSTPHARGSLSDSGTGDRVGDVRSKDPLLRCHSVSTVPKVSSARDRREPAFGTTYGTGILRTLLRRIVG